MTDRPKTVAEAEMRVGCPYCLAPVGTGCTTESARVLTTNHTARYWAAHGAGLLPLAVQP